MADDSRLVYGISIYAKATYLREDSKFKKSVLKEVEALGGRIDLKLLIREYVTALGDVHGQLREMIRQVIETWDATVLNTLDRFKKAHPSESSAAVVAAVQREERVVQGIVNISPEFLQYRKSLQSKNGALANLGKRFVTGEIMKKVAEKI